MRPTAAAALFCAVAAAPALAATCTVTGVNLSFDSYNELRLGHTETAGTLAVTCIGKPGESIAYTLALSSGGGSLAQRRMSGTDSGVLFYNLYTSAARTTVWGDGSSGSNVLSDAYTLPALAITRTYPVYGRIFARQKVPVGLYTDTIIVTLNF